MAANSQALTALLARALSNQLGDIDREVQCVLITAPDRSVVPVAEVEAIAREWEEEAGRHRQSDIVAEGVAGDTLAAAARELRRRLLET